MKSKIEKIESINVVEEGFVTAEVLAKALNDIGRKINEIIDHLNSQDQEEEGYSRVNGALVRFHPMGEDGVRGPEARYPQHTPEEKIEIPEAYRKAFLTEDTPEEWVCPKCDFDNCYPYKNSEDFGLMYCPVCLKLVKLNTKKK